MSHAMEPKTTAKLLLMYSAKCEEGDELRDQLRYALDTIEVLQNEAEAIKDRTLKILSRLAKCDESFEVFPHAKEPLDHWIADHWLVLPENRNLFGKVEDLWEQDVDNPQKALAELSTLKTWEELRENEWIWCCLLEATIQLHLGQTEEAVALLNMALRRCKDHRYSQLRGIAHYFRARYFIIFDNYRTAYWDLCLAAGTDGYASRIEDCIKVVEEELSKPQNSGQSIRKSIGSKGLPVVQDDPQKGFQDWISEIEASTIHRTRHRVPYMRSRGDHDHIASSAGQIRTKVSQKPARSGSKNSFDKAIQSFGPAGERLESVAQSDNYDHLPADVQAEMLGHKVECVATNPILRGRMLDESLVDQWTLSRLLSDLQEQLLNPEADGTSFA